MDSRGNRKRDPRERKTSGAGKRRKDSSDGIEERVVSSGEIGSASGEVRADESVDQLRVGNGEATNTNARINAPAPAEASAAAETKATDDGKEAEGTKVSEQPHGTDNVADKVEEIIEGKFAGEGKDSDENKTVAEQKKSEVTQPAKEIKEAAADVSAGDGNIADDTEEGKESKEEGEDAAGKGGDQGSGKVETASAKSIDHFALLGIECEMKGKEMYEQWLAEVEAGKWDLRRRSEDEDDDDVDVPVQHALEEHFPAPSMTLYEKAGDDEYEDAMFGVERDVELKSSQSGIEFDTKWEDIIAELEAELENEEAIGSRSESASEVGSGDVAQDDPEEEWLVTIDCGYRLDQPKRAPLEPAVGAGKLAAPESCVCLRKMFPRPRGFEYSSPASPRFDNGLPEPVRKEHARESPLEKIVLRKDYSSVTVQFHLREEEMFTRPFRRSATLLDVRRNLASVFNIPVEMINLQKDGVTLFDNEVVGTLGKVPTGSIDMTLTSNDPVGHPVLIDNTLEGAPVAVETPVVINVTMHLPNGDAKEMVVEIVNAAIDKPWLGGYRDVATLVDYHHAFTQTPPLSKKPKRHRDTQTRKPPVTRYQNTPYDKGTQMARDDYFVPNKGDTIVTARPYVPFDDNLSFLKKIITIQRYFRAFLIRRLLNKKSKENVEQVSLKDDLQTKKAGELERLLTGQAIRNVYPRSRQDFSVLYHLVERWRRAEVERTWRMKTTAPRKAELCQVLDTEVRLLNAIEKHRIAVKQDQLERKEVDFMEKSAHPITWVGAKGKVVSMATINTQRAAELRDLYRQLTAITGDTEQRLAVLVSVKHAISAFSCENSKAFDIVALIDRECDMLAHGLRDAQLDFLRKRLAQSFRGFMKVPAFNPEGSKHFTEDTAYLLSRSDTHRCTRCNKYVSCGKCVKTARMRFLQHCASCAWLESVAGERVDLAQIRTIVRALRRDEKKRCCAASIAFIMQEEDFHFLIMTIWHGRSPLGESDYLPGLRLTRWDASSDWSPWNCILLTELETHSHLRLGPPEKAYSATLVAEVSKRHKIGRMHFKKILKMENL